MADEDYPKNNIRKFEHQGTKPIQTIIAIEEAIAFHNTIGSEIKEKRLRYLKNYWVNNVKNLPKVVINTPTNDSERSCAIANFNIEGYKPTELSKLLLEKYKIFSVAIEHPAINGVRITPHLYTLERDLDALVGAIQELARN
jgi:selenocysteine lyase/cysteine desulfurase